MSDAQIAVPAPYRFGFVLTTVAGNKTRYLNLQKYAERDPEVECVWAPITHHLDPDPYHRLPTALRTRLAVKHQAQPVMGQLNRLDAVMFHAFEPYVMAVAHSMRHRSPILVWSQDNPPVAHPERHPLTGYGTLFARSKVRHRLRFLLDMWCARHTALFVPFSHWSANVLTQECGITPNKVLPLHIGLDLELWPYLPKSLTDTSKDNGRLQILFVGTDFKLKGGDLLLDVYLRHFADTADLHLVTKMPPADVPASVHSYTDMGPNDPRLRELYAKADVLVHPTRADMSSWVAMEAMATGRPVIASAICGITDLVDEGENGFLLEPENTTMLLDRLRIVANDPALRQRMGQAGRRIVEERFNAAVCVPRLMERMKRHVDENRAPAKSLVNKQSRSLS
jgi:glycosyltransferase involved in cell wall biosynthesis